MKNNLVQYLIIVIFVVGAYMGGVYRTKIEYLEKGVKTTGTETKQEAQQQQPTAKQPIEMAKVEKIFADKSNLIFGKKGAKIKFVEFSDPSCPYCHIASGKNPEINNQSGEQFKMVSDGGSYIPPEPEIRKLIEGGKAQLAWFYTSGHGNGEMGALALYCANEKNKFWETHDLIMSNEGYKLINETVKNDRKQAAEMAKFLASAVDAKFMQKCLESEKYDERITSDPEVSRGFGYGATPTFFVNDQVVEGAASWDKGFKSIVDSLLK